MQEQLPGEIMVLNQGLMENLGQLVQVSDQETERQGSSSGRNARDIKVVLSQPLQVICVVQDPEEPQPAVNDSQAKGIKQGSFNYCHEHKSFVPQRYRASNKPPNCQSFSKPHQSRNSCSNMRERTINSSVPGQSFQLSQQSLPRNYRNYQVILTDEQSHSSSHATSDKLHGDSLATEYGHLAVPRIKKNNLGHTAAGKPHKTM